MKLKIKTNFDILYRKKSFKQNEIFNNFLKNLDKDKNFNRSFYYNFNKNYIKNLSKQITLSKLKNKKLNNLQITKFSSKIATKKYIRNELKKFQINFIKKNKKVVIEGRDIASKIMPNADLKIFFKCSLEEKAKRRLKDYKRINKNLMNMSQESHNNFKPNHINPILKSWLKKRTIKKEINANVANLILKNLQRKFSIVDFVVTVFATNVYKRNVLIQKMINYMRGFVLNAHIES